MNSNHIEYNGEIFTVTEYNGVSVLMDEEGYYNASKICRDNDKRFSNWLQNDRTKRILEMISTKLEIPMDSLETGNPVSTNSLMFKRKGGNGHNETQGWWIHPKVVHYLAEWADLEYAWKVGEIMDAINERIHLKCTSLEDELDSLHDENDKLKHELESVKDELKTVKDDYDMLNEENEILHENAKNLTNNVNELKTRSVPKGTNDKLLRVLKITDNRFKVSADSYRKRFEYPIVKTFILASSMHVRKELTEDGIIDRLEFNDLDGFCSYIRNNYTVLAEC